MLFVYNASAIVSTVESMPVTSNVILLTLLVYFLLDAVQTKLLDGAPNDRRHVDDKVTVLSTMYVVRKYLDTLSFSYYTIITVIVKKTREKTTYFVEELSVLTPHSRAPSPGHLSLNDLINSGGFGRESPQFSFENSPMHRNNDTTRYAMDRYYAHTHAHTIEPLK